MNKIFVEICKRLSLVIRECLPIPQKTYYKTKKMLKTVVEEIVEKYFLRFLSMQIQYMKDRTKEFFDDCFPIEKKNCKLK
jgi:hypothetical protein